MCDQRPKSIPMLNTENVNLRQLTKQERILIEELCNRHPTEQIRIYETNPLHAAYIDKRETAVDDGALTAIRDAGCTILETGCKAPRWMDTSRPEDKADFTRPAVEFTFSSEAPDSTSSPASSP